MPKNVLANAHWGSGFDRSTGRMRVLEEKMVYTCEHLDSIRGIRKRETFTRREDIAGFFGTDERAKTIYQALGLRVQA
jgi:hypothetical protein